ncbi:MAG: spore germination protein [Eubacteriales bacterium]
MIQTIKKIFRSISINQEKESTVTNTDDNWPVSKNIKLNLKRVKNYFENANDIIIREFELGIDQHVKAFIVMIEGLADKTIVNESLMKSLMIGTHITEPDKGIDKKNVYNFVKDRALSVASVEETKTLEETINLVLSGDVAIFIDGAPSAIIASIRGCMGRAVTEPITETVVRGPREGFVETICINKALLRRKVKNHNLKFESVVIGNQSNTNICIAYINGIADDNTVKEVKSRLKRIKIDAILESGYIESYIQDAPFSVFPTVGNTEKPDIVCAKMLEGRVAILVDGTPMVLTVPYLFVEGLQNSEDYYSRPFFASVVRFLRWVAFLLAITLPSMYIAITSYNQELLPPPLLITIAVAQEGTPFPTFIEALIMLIIFEILREAGVRLPKVIGQAVSIVGALVIGEAAVSAGIVGAPMVIVVALTAITSFVVTPYYDAIALVRLMLTVLAAIAGQYGIMIGLAFVLTHLCSLSSYGIPYFSPIAPSNLSGMKDTFIRVPWWAMIKRPYNIGKNNIFRQKTNQRPNQPKDKKPFKEGKSNG